MGVVYTFDLQCGYAYFKKINKQYGQASVMFQIYKSVLFPSGIYELTTMDGQNGRSKRGFELVEQAVVSSITDKCYKPLCENFYYLTAKHI